MGSHRSVWAVPRLFSAKWLAVLAAALYPLAYQATAQNQGWVVLPVTEYGALRARAYPVPYEPEGPPTDATLTRVDYDLRINGSLALGQASLTVDVLRNGWVRIPIPGGLLVREARLNGNLASLVPGAPGKGVTQLSAVLTQPGRSVLLLDIALPVASAGGEEKLTLPASPSGVTRAAVTIPRQGVDIKVAGGLLSEKSDSGGVTRCLAYGRGNEAVAFAWRRKVDERHANQPVRLRANLTELLGLGEDSSALSAEVNVEVVQGAVSQMEVQLPEKFTVNRVTGATVADWEIQNNVLTVAFLEPVDRAAAFVIAGEAALPRDGAIAIPVVGLSGVERLTGGVAVEITGAGEVKEVQSQGFEKAEAADLGQAIAGHESPSLMAFRFRPGAEKIAKAVNVQVVRYEQQAVLTANIEEARYRVLMEREGKMLVQARYAVRNNQRNFLKVSLPAGAAVWSASSAGRPVHPGQTPDGRLLLPLARAGGGEEGSASAVEIIYLTTGPDWQDKGNVALALPALDLPASRTGLLLYYPPKYRVSAAPGAFRMQPYEGPASALLNPAVAAKNGLRSVNSLPQLDVFQPAGESPSPPGAQALVDKFRARSEARKLAASRPISVSFPAAGPSLFLASELTREDQTPTVEFSYQLERKRGEK